jgi:cytochrome c-type biogenesis protein CcsB
MLKISEYTFVAATLSLALAAAWYLVAFAVARAGPISQSAQAGNVTRERVAAVESRPSSSAARNGTLIAALALAFVLISIASRAAVTGHGPFASMYEFSVAFAAGIVAIHLVFERRHGVWTLGVVTIPVALALLSFAALIPSDPDALVQALKNNLLLTVHVAVAVIAYGTFAVAFAAAALYLVRPAIGRVQLPSRTALEEIAYRAVVIGFPFLTLTIIAGAIWAEAAWGAYWSWDAKETAALATWLIYGAYLHARVARGWRGKRASLLLVAGFAATLFTYFGNLFLGGLHAYSGL